MIENDRVWLSELEAIKSASKIQTETLPKGMNEVHPVILFAQRRFIVGTIALLLSSSAYAENILCPPPDNQASIIRGAWEPQFNGWLDEIIVSRTFVPDQAESAIITCTRTIGTMRIWL